MKKSSSSNRLNSWMANLRITGKPPGHPFKVIREELLSSHMRLAGKAAFESRLMVSEEENANFQYVGREQLPRIYFNSAQIEELIRSAVDSGVDIENLDQFKDSPMQEFWVEIQTAKKEVVRVVYKNCSRPAKTLEYDDTTVTFDYITDVFVEYSDKHKDKYRLCLSRASCRLGKRDLASIHADVVATSSVQRAEIIYYQLAAAPYMRVYAAVQFAFQQGLVCKKEARTAVSRNPDGGSAIMNTVQDYGICLADTIMVSSEEFEASKWSSIQLRSATLPTT